MSKIKLEVGKTYRNRKGEEVRIVKEDGGSYLYKGSDGEWYTESGRCEAFGREHPCDLIEEVIIPDASQKHNEIEVLALQVGKAYVNRKGEEVRIVEKNDKDRHPYQGSNGKVYAENGRWGFLSDKHPEDIIKEVPETRHVFALVPEGLTATRYTFTIPDGTKGINLSKEGNKIVVEMVPEEEPKPGDAMKNDTGSICVLEASFGDNCILGRFATPKEPKPGDVCINEKGSVYIFKGVAVIDTHKSYVWFGKSLLTRSGWLAMDGLCYPGRPATPEEAQPLWDALKKAGKRWNPETMKVEDIPEEGPKPGDVLVNKLGSVYIFKSDMNNGEYHNHFAWLGESGRLSIAERCIEAWCDPGRPATPEEAQHLWDALKKAGKRWNTETMQVEELPEIDRIREWTEKHLDDGSYDHEDVAEAIEAYLNYKEAKK